MISNDDDSIWPIVVSVAAVVGGLAGIARCHDSLGIRISEAFFIAGFLSLTVDLYLKKKLQRDAARDIFHHLLGINLPLEIRETLRDAVLQNRRYITDMQIEARAERVNDRVRLRVSTNSKVVAAADITYEPKLQFEDAERPNVFEVSLSSPSSPKLNFNEKNVVLKRKDDEAEVLEWKGKKTKLKEGDEVHTHAEYSVEGDLHDFWVFNFGTPAICARVRVYGDGLKVTASAADQVNANEYFYKKVFVIGDHLQIRWKPQVP